MAEMVTIEASILKAAWDNWLEFHYGLHCEQLEERFYKYVHPSFQDSFIDDCLDWDNDHETYEVLPQTANYLKLAASTHYHAVFKAYYVKHPWK